MGAGPRALSIRGTPKRGVAMVPMKVLVQFASPWAGVWIHSCLGAVQGRAGVPHFQHGPPRRGRSCGAELRNVPILRRPPWSGQIGLDRAETVQVVGRGARFWRGGIAVLQLQPRADRGHPLEWGDIEDATLRRAAARGKPLGRDGVPQAELQGAVSWRARPGRSRIEPAEPVPTGTRQRPIRGGVDEAGLLRALG